MGGRTTGRGEIIAFTFIQPSRGSSCSWSCWLRSCGRDTFEYPETGGVEMRYAVVIEKTETGYSAYVPDLQVV